MNKKGFAISVILYSIILLIVAILYMLLSITKTRYTTNSKLRENVINDLNNERIGNIYLSDEVCTINGNSQDYTDNLVLTINVNYGKYYKFDDGTWSLHNQIKADHAGAYIGYFRDTRGGEGSCVVDIASRTTYRYRDCASSNYIYGDWYYTTGSCSYDKASAEANNYNCYISGGMVYKRDYVRCDFKTEPWSSWTTTKPDSYNYREIESKTFYKIK